MSTLKAFLGFIGSLVLGLLGAVLELLAPLLVAALGGLIVWAGISFELQWLVSGGVAVILMGLAWFTRSWWENVG
ncbi:MAG: hypothetical protein AAFU79_09635 [Myxococcota bacterium]